MDHPDTSSNTSSKQVRLLPTLGLVGALFCSPRGWGTSSGATGSPAGGARLPHPGYRGADRLGRRALRSVGSGWSATALALFATYTAWTFASLLWSPNRGRRVMYAVETVTGVDYLLKEIL